MRKVSKTYSSVMNRRNGSDSGLVQGHGSNKYQNYSNHHGSISEIIVKLRTADGIDANIQNILVVDHDAHDD